MAQLDLALSTDYAAANNSAFWSKGSLRNHEYESKLKWFFPGYNTTGLGFLSARPDIVQFDYVPCSILRSTDDTQANLNAALRRDASVVEFTAIKDFSLDKLVTYLRDQKMRNYINAVQEQ